MITRGGAVRAVNTSTAGGSETKTITLGADVPANSPIYLGIMNRTNETATLVSVSDPVNGTWVAEIDGPIDSTASTFRTWLVVLPNSAALTGGANRTISVTTSAAVSLQMVAMWENSDLGVMTFQGFSSPQFNPGANTVDYDSTSINADGAGSLVGFLALANAQASAPTADGAGETNQTTGSDAGSFRTTLFTETVAGAGAVLFNSTIPTTSVGIFHSVVMLEGAGGDPAPTITDIDEDDTIAQGQTNISLDGTAIDAATLDIEQGTVVVSQSIDSQTATELIFDFEYQGGAGNHLKNGAATARLTNDDDQEDTHAITVTPPTGVDYVDLTSINVEADYRITAVPDLEAGDQLEWGNVQGGDVSDVEVFDDASFSFAEGVISFDVRAYSDDDLEWGAWETQQAIAVPSEDNSARVRRTTILYYRR